MFHELILVCTSISGVVTTPPELSLANGSTSCVTDTSCEYHYFDGYTCKVAGSSQDVPLTNCEALNVHYERWSNEQVYYKVVLRWLSRIEVVQNTTSEILVELDTLKGRQAAIAALQVAQFGDTLLQRTTIFLTHLLLFSVFRPGCTIVSNNFPFYLKCLDIFKNCFYPKSGNLLNWFSSCGVVLR